MLVALNANHRRADNCGETVLFGERTVATVISSGRKMESVGWMCPLRCEGRRTTVADVELGTRLPTTVSRCGTMREGDRRPLPERRLTLDQAEGRKGVHPVRWGIWERGRWVEGNEDESARFYAARQFRLRSNDFPNPVL